MSRTKNLITIIEGLEKKEFDVIVKSYLKNEYGYEKIVLTDGVNDTGLDIKVFDFKGIHLQFQLTTQKSETTAEQRSFEKKLIEDLEKAKKNFEEYKYSNKLIFFYSYKVTNAKIRGYEKQAFKDYGIELEFIEANRIAEESETILEIQRLLYQFSGLQDFKNKNPFESEEENLVFDLLSFGKPSEFKIQIIESFILQSIYSSDALTKEQIIELCEKKFEVKENEVFYNSLFGSLQTNRKITKTQDKTAFTLPPEERKLIKLKVDQHNLDETVFLSGILSILEKYKQETFITEYVLQLKELYANNFNSDLKSLIESASNEQLFSITKEFLTFIKTKTNEEFNTKDLAKELIQFCVKSTFVQKIAASKVYCKNINNSKLQSYLATRKKIFIDTSIAINALCIYYKPKSNYSNYFYKITKALLDFSKSENLLLNITERYIWEVQNHIKEAFKILPFTKLPNFSKLGSSRNAFYNYYLSLRENQTIESDLTFTAFLEDFGFQENSSQKSINSKIESYLKDLGIMSYVYEKEYNIDETNRLFEKEALNTQKSKSPWARNNDSIMVEFLADNDVAIHPLQPIFVTWDKTFFEVQKVYSKQYPNAQKWLMLPPSKLIDAYSILKFSINSETVSESLLAFISDDLYSNTHALIDTIKIILNTDNEIGLEYTNRLADIRKKEIDDINNNVVIPPEKYEGEAVIDDVFFNLSNHYQDLDDMSKFELFKKIFTKKDLIEDVLKTILAAIDNYYKTREFDNKIYDKFDGYLEIVKKENKEH
jgi:hypothetical protein